MEARESMRTNSLLQARKERNVGTDRGLCTTEELRLWETGFGSRSTILPRAHTLSLFFFGHRVEQKGVTRW